MADTCDVVRSGHAVNSGLNGVHERHVEWHLSRSLHMPWCMPLNAAVSAFRVRQKCGRLRCAGPPRSADYWATFRSPYAGAFSRGERPRPAQAGPVAGSPAKGETVPFKGPRCLPQQTTHTPVQGEGAFSDPRLSQWHGREFAQSQHEQSSPRRRMPATATASASPPSGRRT